LPSPDFGFSEIVSWSSAFHRAAQGLKEATVREMSYYARNHLQDDWASHDAADMQRRVQQAEKEAGWYFDQATKREKMEFDAAMRSLLGVTGPKGNRAREQARTRWREATTCARVLLEATIECLLQNGEVSAELDEQWTALCDRDAGLKEAAE
jgi:hypothetical protein